MNTLAPPRSRILVMIAFALSCIGLLLFLWLSFGGSVPLAPQGYKFSVEFNQAVELGNQADVEIAGVTIGKVIDVGLDHRTGLTRAVLEIDSRYAPRPADTRAVLRQKTLLGETYVQLSPGNPNGPKLPDGGHLRPGQVAPTVQLDQILSTFDPATRRAFETWMQDDGIALTGEGEAFNVALAQLYPFATNVSAVLAVLERDSGATRTLLADGSQVFSALSRSPAQLQGLIRNADSVFATTAARNASLAAAIRALPPFLTGTRETIAQLHTFAADATPLVNQLRPAARQLSPALEATAKLAPSLRTVLNDVGPLTRASETGTPALQQFLTDGEPLLGELGPYLGELVPIIEYIGAYDREVAAFFANSSATTEGVEQSLSSSKLLHYARLSNPVGPESLAAYPKRPANVRSNAYIAPGSYQLRSGLKVFGSYLCTANALPQIGPSVPANLATILRSVYFGGQPTPAPLCRSQSPLAATLKGAAPLSSLSAQFPTLKQLR